MSKAIPLDEQIVATLTGICTSQQAASVLAEAKRTLIDLTKQADAADVSSLSPLATGAQARELRQKASDHRFEADRMEASISALEARAADLKDAEARVRREARLKEVKAVRDALAADIARDYPRIVGDLARLAKEIVENDMLCAEVGLRDSAELIGRGLTGIGYVDNTPVRRIQDIKIQMPASGSDAYGETTDGWFWSGLELAPQDEAA
jgi:hypothetical protein